MFGCVLGAGSGCGTGRGEPLAERALGEARRADANVDAWPGVSDMGPGSPWTVTTLAGNGTVGYRDGTGGRTGTTEFSDPEAEALLAARHPDRPLKANVEFYTAVLLEAVGLPRTLFTPTFAASRAAGWCAHVDEQRKHGRLIRPKSRYVDVPPRLI